MSILASRAARRASSRVRATTANSAWPWNRISLSANKRLVGEDGRDVVLAGNVGGGQHRDDARRGAHGGKIESAQGAARLVGHADRDMQRPVRLADVVDIGRRAADVQARRIMRQRLVDDRRRSSGASPVGFIQRHGASPIRVGALAPEISISAFSRRLAATRRAIGGGRAHDRSAARSPKRARRSAPRQLAASSRSAPISARSAAAARFGVAAMPP